MVRRDKRVVWIHCEAIISSEQTDCHPVWEGVLIDITERKRVEASLGLRERQQQAVAALGQCALKRTDLTSLLRKAVLDVSQSLDVESSTVFEVLPDGETVLPRAGVRWQDGHVGETPAFAHRDGSNALPPTFEYQAGYTLISNHAVISEDLSIEERFDGPSMVEAHGVRSGVSVVISGHGKPFGVLGAHSTRSRSFDGDDILFLQSIANVIGSFIVRSDTHWFTVTDIAGSLQVTEETVRRWIRQSDLPALNLGGPRAGYRVYPSDLERFIAERLIRV